MVVVDISIDLAAIAAMLFSIVLPEFRINVDGFNSPTTQPRSRWPLPDVVS